MAQVQRGQHIAPALFIFGPEAGAQVREGGLRGSEALTTDFDMNEL